MCRYGSVGDDDDGDHGCQAEALEVLAAAEPLCQGLQDVPPTTPHPRICQQLRSRLVSP